MSSEALHQTQEKVEGNRFNVVDMEIQPNSVAEGEIGRDFWASSREGDETQDYQFKSWDGRIGYKKDINSKYAYIVAAPSHGTLDSVRFIQIPMGYRKFRKLLNYKPELTDFRAQNESLTPMREFIAMHLKRELDKSSYIRKP